MPAKKPMDPWLKNLVESKTGGFRAAKWERCHHCNQITLTGINDDICAWTITVDPTPLTPQQELECLLSLRDTASATPHGKTYDLHHRDADMISDYPAGGPNTYGTVLPNHQCGNRYPGFLARNTAAGWDPTINF